MECGTKLPDGAKFCMNCGTKLGEVASAPAAPAAPAAARGCTPGKKYEVFKIAENKGLADQKKFGQAFFKGTEIESNAFYCDYYTRLDDGTAVGWIYKHIKKYADEKDYYYNLYRLDMDGTATFLGTGARSGIEDMYVLDGYAYWYGFGTGEGSGAYRKNIYDNSPVEKL